MLDCGWRGASVGEVVGSWPASSGGDVVRVGRDADQGPQQLVRRAAAVVGVHVGEVLLPCSGSRLLLIPSGEPHACTW